MTTTSPTRSSPSRKLHISDDVIQSGILTLALLVALVVLTILSRSFLTAPNMIVILQSMSVLCIASIGQTLVIISGGFDLSVGGVIPLSGMVYAIVANTIDSTAGILIAFAASLAAGAAFGLLNGVLITKVRISPLITTLGTMSIAGGLAFVISQGLTVVLSDSSAAFLAGRIIGNLSWDVLFFVLLAVLTSLVLHQTIWGRRIYSIGGNAEAVRRAGVRTDRSIIWIYVWSALFAATAGIIATSQLRAASAATYSDAALSTVTAVILGGAALAGGRGSIHGTILGSLLLAVIANGLLLLQVDSFYQTVVTGVLLLGAVSLMSIRSGAKRPASRSDPH